jgi:uncharacterized membrane protein (DUF106 family)
MFGVWLVYVGAVFPIFLLFMSLGQSLHVAMIIASVLTFLFIIVQRTFRGLHLINQLQKNMLETNSEVV